MESAVFRKLVLWAVVAAGLTLAALDYAVSRHVRNERLSEAEERLRSIGAVIARSSDPARSLTEWCRVAPLRLQLLDANGAPVADCNGASSQIEAGDLRAAVSLPIRVEPSNLGVLRLSSPIRSGANRLRLQVAAIAGAGAMLAAVLLWWIARSVYSRVDRMRRYASSLLNAQGVEQAPTRSGDGVADLEVMLHRLATHVESLSERCSLEASRMDAILSSMAEGVLAVDHDLRVIFCNGAAIRAMGIRTPVRERTPVLEIMRDSELVRIIRQAVSAGDTLRENLKIARADGRAFQLRVAPLSTATGMGALALFYDTTDLERLEQVRKDFVANVSHEMRTPLASIVGYSDTLLDGGLEDAENNRKFLHVIRTNAIRLNSIASDLLVLSELDSGNDAGEVEQISIRDVIESGMSGVEGEARSRNVHLVRGEIAEARVWGHRFRLEQAISNLLVNAVKFNKDGGEVRVEARETPDGVVRVSVSDTGVGIPSQDLPRIFERFYRVDKARSRQVGGTGLGLSIVRHAVERMNGRVEVESQLGKGSTFTILLPSS